MEESIPLHQSVPTQEAILGEWDEADHAGIAMSSRQFALTILGSIALAVVSVFLAIWQHDADYYFATVVFVLLIVSLISQTSRKQPRLHIVITTLRIIVGKRQYMINELSGFWLSKDRETTVINLETPKPGIVPISFLYATLNEQEARTTLGQVLPEMEPRIANAGDTINRYFRF